MACHDDVVIFYDDFDYLQKARHQTIGDPGTMYNYTTAKWFGLGNPGYHREDCGRI
jgi:hypothetical protein